MGGDDLAKLIARARQGDSAATADLLGRFESEIRVMVRVRLPRVLRSKYDSMDFVQAVWTSVFTRSPDSLAVFQEDRHFLAFLTAIARNKVFQEHRKQTRTKKYDITKERPLYVRRGNREVPVDVAGHGPSPSEELQMVDRLEQILDGRDSVERAVVHLRRRGLTYQEIAERTGFHESVVRRMVDAIRQRLEAREWR